MVLVEYHEGGTFSGVGCGYHKHGILGLAYSAVGYSN